MTFRERVEENVTLWLLGSLLTGFLSGIATYRAVQEIAGLEPISKSDHQALLQKANESEARAGQVQSELNKVKSDYQTLQQKANETERCANELQTETDKKPKAAAVQADYPELHGGTVLLYFNNRVASQVVEMKTKLEKLGMTVDWTT